MMTRCTKNNCLYDLLSDTVQTHLTEMNDKIHFRSVLVNITKVGYEYNMKCRLCVSGLHIHVIYTLITKYEMSILFRLSKEKYKSQLSLKYFEH